ncbi:NUCLEAR PORE COMPLEX PROTEIN NUP205 [Salix viminalis]|uniref:NUCLEAR PORE COMPLEX PROTEIN NUP205 n=1 Tax=Salix viminalis TaxID=40686 RepID=A0A9Q0U185_SALVM|nr:NUCLEAR PORE COMPLEX PROTEIN NUP205 [Salix viminalis]
MVLGLRSKNRKGTSVQLDYLIFVQEIKPWPPSQSLKSAQSLLLQWENGDQSSGSCTSNVGDGKVEFSESFRLSVTLCKEVSRKGTARDSYLKNYLEFNLYESRNDKAMKGQLLGSAVINLADYGIIMDAVTINAPIHFKKSSRSMVPAVLYVNIQQFDRDRSSLSKQVSLDKDGSETVSEVTNEGNDDEVEIASFTDEDDDGSSHSSLPVSSSALESRRGSPGQSDKKGSGTANNGTKRIDGEPAFPSGVAHSNLEAKSAAQEFKHPNGGSPPLRTDMTSNLLNPVNNPAENVVLLDDCSQLDKKSNHVGLGEFRAKQDADRKPWRYEMNGLENATTDNLYDDLMDEKEKRELDDKGQSTVILEVRKPAFEKKLHGQLLEDASKKQAKLRSNTLALNRTAIGVQGNTRRDKLKHLKSVQLQFNSAEGEDPFINSQFMEKTKKINISENVNKGAKDYPRSEREKSTKGTYDNQGESKSKVEILKEELSGAASKDGLAEQGNSKQKFQLMEKEKEIDLHENVNKVDMSYERSKREEETKGKFSGNKVELESKVEMLEEELMEAAAVEVGLYSVVAEHGSSINKVLAPARRLSRFYLYVCKAGSWAKRANAARAIISGLILVSKACGNDVPRLTFWLSNTIVLRAIVSQAVEKLKLASVPSRINGPRGRQESTLTEEKTNKTESLDEWAEPQPYIAALEKVEAWIFSRIVESVWWQTLTPHMQSTAVKSSNSRKTHARRHGLGDQEQGNLAIDLWKKAFRDACERLCPVRAGGHECGCLPVLSRLVMEQLVSRLDVAMFNAILRESAEEMPTDPVSDPISDPKVLPIPAGNSSFGAGAQLKNAVGNWSRWLTDLFGIDDSDSSEEKDELNSTRRVSETSFKAFHLLNALSDLMMLPFEMLADRSTRKEVCPSFDAPMIKRVLNNFVPDEFNPDPIPETIFEALDAEDLAESGEEYITNFPCIAVPTIYSPPRVASLTSIIGEVGGQTLQRSRSAMLRKSYTSDDELDELDSPMTSIIENSKASPASTAWNWMQKGKAGRKVVRYQLLREVWKDGE